MKILILVDLLNSWAIHNRAKAIQKRLPEHEIIIRSALGNTECVADGNKFDVVHFNFTFGITAHTKFILDNRDRCLITIVNERSYDDGYGVEREKLLQILALCPHITSVSTRMAEITGGKWIPNGIDEDIFDEPKLPVVGYAGTDREYKNPAAIKEACEVLGLRFKCVTYVNGRGEVRHEDMQDFYRSIDVYVHASHTEGFSNVVLEALACNVPVLMTRKGAFEVFDGYVTYIEPTATGVAEGLKKFLGRRLVNEKFLWRKIVPMYEQKYKEIHAGINRIPQPAHV